MPFGGLLTVGLISAGGALGSAAIGASASGKAGKLLYEKGNQVGQSIDKATGGAIAAGYAGVNQANTALDTGLKDATTNINSGVKSANDVLGNVYSDQEKSLAPYLQAGSGGISQLQALLAPGGSLSSPISPDMMKDDPGYQFRLSEGLKAIERSAAGRTGALGGATTKAEERYAQDYASGEYGAAYQRALQGRQQQFGMLSGLAGFGQEANTQNLNAGFNFGDRTSGNLMTGAGTLASADLGVGGQKANTALQGNEYIGSIGLQGANEAGNAYMGGALGKASGDIASGNAWSNALSNTAGTLGGLLLLNQWNQAGNGGIGQIDRAPGVPQPPPSPYPNAGG